VTIAQPPTSESVSDTAALVLTDAYADETQAPVTTGVPDEGVSALATGVREEGVPAQMTVEGSLLSTSAQPTAISLTENMPRIADGPAPKK
jgi:hypothetical protein